MVRTTVDDLVPRLEFCRQVKIDARTARRWVQRGYGPRPRSLGGRVYYLQAEIDAWIADIKAAPSVVA